MKINNNESISVIVKRKNISALLEYCVENKIEFSVKPMISRSEEFEVDFTISTTKKAVALGMYLKELRLELNGTQVISSVAVSTPAPAKTSRKSTFKESTNGHNKEETVTPISFDSADKLEFEMETSTN